MINVNAIQSFHSPNIRFDFHFGSIHTKLEEIVYIYLHSQRTSYVALNATRKNERKYSSGWFVQQVHLLKNSI